MKTDYFNYVGILYEPEEPKNNGWTSTIVLPELTGKPWDDVALCYVSTLRPSYIRVIKSGGTQSLDARTWRVTVYLDKNDKIDYITQEVQFDSVEKLRTGSALHAGLVYGLNSPQTEWYNDDKIDSFSDGLGGYWKYRTDGTRVQFPE